MDKKEKIKYLQEQADKKLEYLETLEARGVLKKNKQARLIYEREKIALRDIVDELELLTQQTKEEERGNEEMKKMEVRNNDFEAILRGETRSLNTTNDGASVIPENVHGEIIVKMEEISPVFAKAKKINSVSGTLKVAREDDKVQAGFVGEGEKVLEGALGFTHVELKQKRVGAAITLANQLINDSAVNIQDYTKNLLARRTVKAIEKSMLTGQGGVEFNGIIHDADVEAVNVANTIEIDQLQALYLAIHPEFLSGASFVMARNFFNEIAKLKDGNEHYYIQNGVVNGKLTYTLFGMPIDITDALPAETPVVFGNIEEAYSVMIKQESGIQEIVDSQQALRGSKMFVFDMYADGVVVNPQAVAKLVVG
ncbi:phage major capsid protein [Halalkalibacter krulwichiae]|uniref:Phage capsid family protein n=1 Tax=Halalkalibacter krulwichiae TaxID=199441 RepID=A0A1X9M6I8_9BACI|nr:phage major capsid protein [Halalkalibacter krulwichiae]ARK29046.1 Phage capsid family protein [Halalkalibacter krulwichiae]